MKLQIWKYRNWFVSIARNSVFIFLWSHLVFDQKWSYSSSGLKLFKLFSSTLLTKFGCRLFPKLNLFSKEEDLPTLWLFKEWAPGFESNSARRISKRFCATAAFLGRFLGSFSDYLRDNSHMFLKQISPFIETLCTCAKI